MLMELPGPTVFNTADSPSRFKNTVVAGGVGVCGHRNWITVNIFAALGRFFCASVFISYLFIYLFIYFLYIFFI